jgi:hypothetical protein
MAMTHFNNRRRSLRTALAFGAGVAAWPFSRALGAPAKTTQSEPEGFFTLGRQKDHRWLITPDGKPFFSLGINHASAIVRDGTVYWTNKRDPTRKMWR